MSKQKDQKTELNLLYSWYIVGVLMLAYLLSYVDRSILSLLVSPIRADLNLSDTQLSLLHGFAFALFYAALGFPIGRMADSKNRVKIIIAGIGLWSLFTVVCGLARNFGQLFAARVGVGIGEAALNPCAYSIITDRFPPHLLSRALSSYVMGTYMGFGTAFIIGGYVVQAVTASPTMTVPVLGEIYTWQAAFFYVGLPGILLMLLVGFTVKEPIRTGLQTHAEEPKTVPLSEVVDFVRLNKKTLASHLIGFSFIGILVNGLVLWTPTFFNRTYGIEVASAGVQYGIILLLCGPAGIFLGGWIADRVDQGQARGGSFVAAAGCVTLGIVPAILGPLMPTSALAFIMIAWLVLATSAPWGVAVSAIQKISPNEMRGQISALYLFVVNLIGIGFGPTSVALITDLYFKNDLALKYSMSIVGGGAAVLGALALWIGLEAFKESSHRAVQWNIG